MKRLFALVLSLILVISMMPVDAVATESNSERDELIALACEVFPEYANKISTTITVVNSHSRSVDSREIVASESRSASNGDIITYTEYSDGLILLSDTEFYSQITYNDRQTGANATVVDISIRATCNLTNKAVTINNIIYTLNGSGYDSINAAGTASTVSGTSASRTVYRANETASQPAKLEYHLSFRYANSSGSIVDSYLTLTVKNNSATVTHIDFNDA